MMGRNSTAKLAPKSESGCDSVSRTRRGLLAAVSGAVVGSSAGCLDLLGLTPQGGPGGMGGGAVYPSVSYEEADRYVESAGALADAGQSGDIVWIEDGTYDVTGMGQIEIGSGTWIAGGRSEESAGAALVSEDRGSPGEHTMFDVQEGGRLTGLTMRGALYNYTDSPVVPGYVPLAPGGSYSSRQSWRDRHYCQAAHVTGNETQIDNCEIWGFSTAIEVGRGEEPVNPNIFYNHIHNCMLTSDGYCVHVNSGMPSIHGCTFDAYRHAINGFGYPDAGYLVTECQFGPHKSSFDIDMHRLEENIGGSGDSSDYRYRHRAGGTMIVRDCVIVGTRVIDDQHHNGANAGDYDPRPYVNQHKGNEMTHVHVRGIPAEAFVFERNQCSHFDPTTAVNQTLPGSYSGDDNGWNNVSVLENFWGVDFGLGF